MDEIRCPNCGTSFLSGEDANTPTYRMNGIHYLVPETIRNEKKNIGDNKMSERLEALKKAGINVDVLKDLMNGNSNFKDIFVDKDDPVIKELEGNGFIRNKELFRRWITAQTFRLIKWSPSWTEAVNRWYDIRYVFKMTKTELATDIIIKHKSASDRRLEFFRLENFKDIFVDLMKFNYFPTYEQKKFYTEQIKSVDTLEELLDVVRKIRWAFPRRTNRHLPASWLNCFKGAGAYYTLQNIIRTHGLVIPSCKDMNSSLEKVEVLFQRICSYPPRQRRWDILMSLLISSVRETRFELKY